MLIQQCSNWLLNQYSAVLKGQKVVSPLGSVLFLEETDYILRLKFNHQTVDEAMRPESKIFIYFESCDYNH